MNPPLLSNAGLLMRVAVIAYSIMALSGLAFLWLQGELARLYPVCGSRLGALGIADDFLGNVGLGMWIGVVTVILSDHTLTRSRAGHFLQERFSEALEGLRPGQAVALAVLSGIGEELLFRGLVLIALAHWLSPAAALITSSLVFAAVHVGPDRRFIWWTVFAFLMGLLLGSLYLATGSLQAPIVLHATVNGLNLVRESWQQRLAGFGEGRAGR